MKFNYLIKIVFLVSFIGSSLCRAQIPTIQWQKSYGGSGDDEASSIIQTTDGGYIAAGFSNSTNGDVTGNHIDYDYWIVKLTSTGTIQWQKSLGGSGDDKAISIIQTSDGGYMVAGYSNSTNGDAAGNHGFYDYWIVKLSATGTIQWQKTIGGSADDKASNIIQTTDGGYIITGSSLSNNGDVSGNHGGLDSWIVKLTSSGSMQWQKSYGGTGYEELTSIIQTTDGGYILAGYTTSSNGDLTSNHGQNDSWIVKLTSTGTIQWQKTFGGTDNDVAASVSQTTDGGYVVSIYSNSIDGDVTVSHGLHDSWIIKLSSTGSIQWQKFIGGTNNDYPLSVKQTSDAGYMFAGFSGSTDGDVTGNHGNYDFWIVKLNGSGILQWQKSLGGTGDEVGLNAIQTNDNGYCITGFSSSTDGDVTGNHGNNDFWIVKLTPDNLSNYTFTEETCITIYPNPAKENLTVKLNYFSPSQEFTITDIQGKIIHAQKLESLSTTINTSSFEKGIYFLNLIDDAQKTSQKFIIE